MISITQAETIFALLVKYGPAIANAAKNLFSSGKPVTPEELDAALKLVDTPYQAFIDPTVKLP